MAGNGDGASFGSNGWLKASATNVGKGAKIQRDEGFLYKGVRLFIDSSRPAFLGKVYVTCRSIPDEFGVNKDYGPVEVTLAANHWQEVLIPG